jgi:hypothetical protein
MATLFSPNGMPQGAVQFPPAQHAQQGQQMPTGQQVQGGGQQIAYGVDSLPAMPQPQGQQFAPQGQQNYGLQFPQQTAGLQQPPQQQTGWVQPQQQQQTFQQQAQQGWMQPQGQQLPQGQPGAGQGGLNLQTRLQGAGIPQELQGRTVGEALGIYSALATDWMSRQRGQQTPAGQSLQQMQQPPVQQGQQPAGPQQMPWQSRVAQQQAPAGQPNLWTNPEETIGQIVEQKIGPMLAPITQHTQQAGITQAYSIANQSVVDFRTLEPEIMQMLAGADPGTLQNPQTWIGAADIIRGRQVREGRYQQPPQQNGQQVQGQQMPSRQGNPSMVGAAPAGQQGQMPVYGFFTEQPSAPGVPQFGAGQASGQDIAYAQRFGMPLDQYMSWKYGVQQNGQAQQGYQQQMGGVR